MYPRRATSLVSVCEICEHTLMEILSHINKKVCTFVQTFRNMKYATLLLVCILLSGCKGEKKSGVTISEDDMPSFPVYDERLPDACTLLSESKIASLLNLDKNSLEVKDGSNPQNLFSKSCFYKWEDEGVKNAGIMIQVMTNPVEDEAPEYLSIYISSKKTRGEQSMDSDKPFIYKDFVGIGDDGAYSYEMHKYMWRKGNDYSFLLAFNAVLTEKEELEIAKKLAVEVMKNFN